MRILIESEIEVASRPGLMAGGTSWEQSMQALKKNQGPQTFEAIQFCYDSPLLSFVKEARDYAIISCRPGSSIHEVAIDLMHRIYREFKFDPASTTVSYNFV